MTETFETTSICDKSDIVSFASKYELKNSIRCSIETCKTPHKKGYAVILKNGTQAQIGHICGKRLLGDDIFARMQRDLESKERSALRQQFISSSGFDPAGAQALLQLWAPRVREIRKMIAELKSSLRNFYPELQRCCAKNDGRIGAYTIEGRRFLVNDVWDDYFDMAQNNLKRINEILDKQELNERELKDVVSKSSHAARFLRVTADVLDDFRAFSTVNNLTGIAKWIEAVLTERSFTPVPLTIAEYPSHIVLCATEKVLFSVPKHTTDIDRTPIAKLSPS